MNNPLEDLFIYFLNLQKKGQMYLNHQYEKNWCKRSLEKDAKCIIKDFFRKPWPFDSKKPFALVKSVWLKHVILHLCP